VTNKRKRGRPTKGDRPAKRIGFYVSADDHEWLTALPNRSEWIAKKIAEDRNLHAFDSENDTKRADNRADRSGAHQDAK
jgi:hypothetical protein